MIGRHTLCVVPAGVLSAGVDTDSVESVAELVWRTVFVVLAHGSPRVSHWQTSDKAVAMESLGTAAVRAMIGVDAYCVLCTGVVHTARVLAHATDARLRHATVLVHVAHHSGRP